MIEQFKKKDPTVPKEVSWINENFALENEKVWQETIFNANCQRVSFWKNTPFIQAQIRAREEKQLKLQS